jgi:hypothetical protein
MNKLTLTLILILASFMLRAQTKSLTVHFELALNLSGQGSDAQFQREILKKRKKDGYHLNQRQIQDIALNTGFNRLRFPVYAASGSTLLFTQKKITQEVIIDSAIHSFYSELNVDSIEIRDQAGQPKFILHTSAAFDCNTDNLLSQNWYLRFNTWQVEKALQPELHSGITFIYNKQSKTFPAVTITVTPVDKTATEPGHLLLIYNRP